MTKQDLDWMFILFSFIILAPIGWLVFAHYSWTVRLIFVAGVLAAGYIIRVFVYQRFRSRLPDNDEDRS